MRNAQRNLVVLFILTLALPILALPIVSCEKSPKRLKIGRGDTSTESIDRLPEFDRKLQDLASDKDADCLPLKQIADELRSNSQALFTLSTHSVGAGEGLDPKTGTGFTYSLNNNLKLASMKHSPPLLEVALGVDLESGRQGELLAVSEQVACDTVTFSPKEGEPQMFRVVRKDGGVLVVANDQNEVRYYSLPRLQPGTLSVVVVENAELKACPQDEAKAVQVRHELRLNWGTENLQELRLERAYLKTIADNLSEKQLSEELKETLAQKPRRASADSSEDILISYPLFTQLQSLLETGDFAGGKCKKP